MKKILIIFFWILILIVLLIIFIPKRVKANILFGTGECKNAPHTCTDDYSQHKCYLCKKTFIGSSSKILCDECSEELGRCDICGKKNK